MAKLTRVTGKVFGNNAPLNEIGVFGSAKAGNFTNSQDVATIQSLPAYQNGWGSAIMTSRNFPPIEEVTGVLKTISYQNCYLLQEGIPEYDANTNYSNTSVVKNIDGQTLSFFLSQKADNIGNPLTDGTSWLKANLNSARNIGEIITSAIPLTDSGVHLLDGALINGAGTYKEFVDYMVSIYNSSLNYFCTEAEWQTSVNTYGSCGKFVYTPASGGNPATIRLPKVSDILQGTSDVTALGDLVDAGLPNITGLIGASHSTNGTATGAFIAGDTIGSYIQGSQSYTGLIHANIGFDASRSSSIYGNSDTVQPQTIKVLYYIVISNAEKTDIEVDIDNIATDLNGKADTDLSNTTAKLSDSFVNKLMPDYANGIDITSTLKTSPYSYTAPTAGVIKFYLTGDVFWLIAANNVNNSVLHLNAETGVYITSYLAVSKNQTIYATDTRTGNLAMFYPLKGAN